MSLQPVPDEIEQMEFEGFPIKQRSYELRSTKGLHTDTALDLFSPVRGIFDGRVKGLHHDELQLSKDDPQAALKMTWIVEVLGAEIGARCPNCGERV